MARRLFRGIIFTFCLLAQGVVLAAPAHPSATAPVQEARQPNWAELSAEQRRILAPVAGEWDKMPTHQRKKLLGVAQGYPKKTPEEQQRIQRRLKNWSSLTTSERELARKKYEQLKQLPPEKRQEVKQKWQQYKELPEEKKEALRRNKAEAAKTLPASPETPTAAPVDPASAEAAKPTTN